VREHVEFPATNHKLKSAGARNVLVLLGHVVRVE
jgi:hypothetical protein